MCIKRFILKGFFLDQIFLLNKFKLTYGNYYFSKGRRPRLWWRRWVGVMPATSETDRNKYLIFYVLVWRCQDRPATSANTWWQQVSRSISSISQKFSSSMKAIRQPSTEISMKAWGSREQGYHGLGGNPKRRFFLYSIRSPSFLLLFFSYYSYWVTWWFTCHVKISCLVEGEDVREVSGPSIKVIFIQEGIELIDDPKNGRGSFWASKTTFKQQIDILSDTRNYSLPSLVSGNFERILQDVSNFFPPTTIKMISSGLVLE